MATDGFDESSKKKSLGKKLLGVFFEDAAESDLPSADFDAPDEVTAVGKITSVTPKNQVIEQIPVAQIASAHIASPAASSSQTDVSVGRPTPPPNYKVPDFMGIFKSAGMADDERDRLTKAEELLKTLPAETPAALKRQIVEGTLRAFAIAPEKITAAANKGVSALNQYNKISETDLIERTSTLEKKLAELQAEQEKVQAILLERQSAQKTLQYDLFQREIELRAILNFFETPVK